MEQVILERVEILLLAAAIVAMLARRLKLPYTVGLVLTGLALGFTPYRPQIALTDELLYSVLLPPLIFEAAISITWPELRRDLGLVLVLAVAGVLVTAALTAAGMQRLVGWHWAPALLFGVLISATDPVAVIATFKDAKVRGRLRLLVESESLFNDGVAAVLFAIALVITRGGTVGPLATVGLFAWAVVGGVVCGVVGGVAALALAGRTEDPLLEITFTTVAAYGSFFLAQHLQVSGVLAALVAGLIVGNVGVLGSLTARGREAVTVFWEYLAFAANAIIFILIGMQLAYRNFTAQLLPIGVAILLITAGRALAVYGSSALFARSSHSVAHPHQHILVWGGLRGALALALALGLPADTPQREAVVTVAFAVVAFSVIVQGLTIGPVIARLETRRTVPQPDDLVGMT
jgi:monovalent cation:H+ antiporter, CPA1 family